jgi:hypothetical protein
LECGPIGGGEEAVLPHGGRWHRRQQDVFINIVEVAKENWSFGNGEMQYAP